PTDPAHLPYTTLFRSFKRHGMQVVGVDPATDIARAATAKGIETVNAFFSEAVARELRERYGPASFITSHNACAHIDHLDDVINGDRKSTRLNSSHSQI